MLDKPVWCGLYKQLADSPSMGQVQACAQGLGTHEIPVVRYLRSILKSYFYNLLELHIRFVASSSSI